MYASQLASLPEATAPPERRGMARDAVKLLVTDRASGMNHHARFFELPSALRPGDVLVVNDSATIAAALSATRASGEAISLHISTRIDRRVWMVEPRNAVVSGEELRLPDNGSAVMIAPVEPERPRVWYAWFQLPGDMYPYLAKHGRPIRYGYVAEEFSIGEYQTIFSREHGSSEMPSAARPFSERVLYGLKARGIDVVPITLHCGVASFEEPERVPAERFAVAHETASALNQARTSGRRIIAVGSTALRALESSYAHGSFVASQGWTDLVIDDDRPITTVDGLLTGFHDVAATHQAILRAFLGRVFLARAYAEAARARYYQHEFGDSHLIL